MRNRYLTGIAIVILLLLPRGAQAQRPQMGLYVKSPSKQTPLSDQRIYKLTFTCSARADLKNSQSASLFIRSDRTSSHFIVISDKVSSTDGSGNAAFPTTGTAFLPVFAITNGVVKIDNRTSCPNPQYITGGPDLYLQSYASYSTKNQPGILLNFGFAVAKLIPPLWGLFNFSLANADKGLLTNATAVQDPLKATLSSLDTDENYPASVVFGAGDFEVVTDFSRVKINVKYVPSIIKDGGTTAMKFFRKQIDTSNVAITSATLNLCGQLATSLVGLGFSKTDDIPYALAYKGIKSSLTANDASTCLGDDYAVAAASIPGGLWEYAGRKENVLTVDQAIADHPPVSAGGEYQIPFDADLMKTAIDALSRLTRNDVAASEDQIAFSALIKEPITLDDKSVSKVFGGAARPYTGSELAAYLTNQGYRRFGCAVSTTLGEKLDHGKTVLLAFKASKDDLTLPIDNVVVVKPIFSKRLITKFIAYDDYDWINTVLTGRNWKCGRTTIKQPTSSEPVSAPNSAPKS